MEHGFAAFSGRGLARRGLDIDGRPVGDAAFIETTRTAHGTFLEGPRQGRRYSKQMFTNGIWGSAMAATVASSSWPSPTRKR